MWPCFSARSFILGNSWVEHSRSRENQFCLCFYCFTDVFRMPPHPPIAQIPAVFLSSSLKLLAGSRTIFSLLKTSWAWGWEGSSTLRVKLQWPGTAQIKKSPGIRFSSTSSVYFVIYHAQPVPAVADLSQAAKKGLYFVFVGTFVSIYLHSSNLPTSSHARTV